MINSLVSGALQVYSSGVVLVLGRVVDLGLTIECLLADRAFASAAGIDTMQTTAPVIAPLIRRGKELAKLLDTQVSYWSDYAMYEGTARGVVCERVEHFQNKRERLQ